VCLALVLLVTTVVLRHAPTAVTHALAHGILS
jgi:hypothetical protein